MERLVPWAGVARKCVQPVEACGKTATCVQRAVHGKPATLGELWAACGPHGSAAAVLEGQKLHLVLLLLMLVLPEVRAERGFLL